MEGFEKEEQRKEGDELRTEVVPEDCERQAGFGHGIPDFFHQVLKGDASEIVHDDANKIIDNNQATQ